MNLYKISQYVNNDYDTYDSAIVAAKNEDEAKLIHPDDEPFYSSRTWTTNLDDIQVELIGKAAKHIEKGVILASFNAG